MEDRRSSRICEQCEETESIFQCRECQLNYCDSCAERFHSKGKLKDHSLTNINAESSICESCENVESTLFCDICSMKFCEPCWSPWHAKGTLKRHERKPLLVDTVIDISTHNKTENSSNCSIPQKLQKSTLGYISNPQGKRAKYYMEILPEANQKMRKSGENDVEFGKRFISERSRQFGILTKEEELQNKTKSITSRYSKFIAQNYTMKPGDGRQLMHGIDEHARILNKLDETLEEVKKHDNVLFASNGRSLREGSAFQHAFNVGAKEKIERLIASVNAQKVALQQLADEYSRIFKGSANKFNSSHKRKKKENKRKAKKRKETRYNSSINHVYNVCIKNPIDVDLPDIYSFPPSFRIPESFIDTENCASVKGGLEAKCVADIVSKYLTNAAASRLLTNLREEVANKVFSYMYPDEDAGSIDIDNLSLYEDDSDDAGDGDEYTDSDEDSDSVDRAVDDEEL